MQAGPVVERWCEKWFKELCRRHADERYQRRSLPWPVLAQEITEVERDLCRRDYDSESAREERVSQYPAKAVAVVAARWLLEKIFELPRDKNHALNPADKVFLAIIDQAFQRAFGVDWWEARRGATPLVAVA